VDGKLLPQAFFDRPADRVARELLGAALVVRAADGRLTRHMVFETEAYLGAHDLACHGSRGLTQRNATMFGPAGHWYVYLCYGVHEMLNLVVGPRDWPAAVLIRGVEGSIGPGRLTKALGIDRRLNATAATGVESGLWLEDRGTQLPRRAVQITPRIGVDYSGPVWSAKPWRFMIEAPTPHERRAARRRVKLPPASSPGAAR
jgi:DNA-3-methyladenine glycosylase